MRIPFVGDIPEARRQTRAAQAESGGEAGTVHKLEECYQASDSARRQFEGEWVDNILFLEGRQWEKAAEDVRRGRKLPVRAPESRVQMTANWTYTLARQAVAGLRDNLAEQIAVPATADPMDEAAAEVATDWLAFQYDQDGEDTRRYHEILWAMVTGRSVRKSTWDPSRDGLGLVRGRKVTLSRAGDIASVSLNPWRFHVDPWSETFEEASYVIESDVRDVQEINDLYPGHAVAAEEVAVGLGMVQGLANASLRGGGGYAQRRKEAAVLKRMYCRPTTKYPKGRVYTWANGKLLQTRDLPEGEMPFVALDWFYIPGRLVPLAFITPSRGDQVGSGEELADVTRSGGQVPRGARSVGPRPGLAPRVGGLRPAPVPTGLPSPGELL